MRNLPSHEYEVELLHMRFAFTQCAWFGIAFATVALSPISNQTIIQNVVASTSPSGVNIFLAHTPAQGDTKPATQLCWGGERGVDSKAFRLTALTATDSAGKSVPLSAVLGDANLSAWREASGQASKFGDTMANSIHLATDPQNALSYITQMKGTLELKLGKNVIRIPPASREKYVVAQSSLLQAKGFKLIDLGEEQRLNLQFAYSGDKRGFPQTIFLLDETGKPIYSSKPRIDELTMFKISPTDPFPQKSQIRFGLDKKNIIPDALKILQSKDLLTSTLGSRGLRVKEFSCQILTKYIVEILRSPDINIVPELVIDFSGKKIKGQSTNSLSKTDPALSQTTTWIFDVPSEFIGKRPDILVLVPGDEGLHSVAFEFHTSFAPETVAK